MILLLGCKFMKTTQQQHTDKNIEKDTMNEITPGKVTIDAGADTPSVCEKLDELKFEGDGDDISAATWDYSMNSERRC